MRFRLLSFFLLINLFGYAQSLKELEFQLHTTPISELDSVRQLTNQIFKIDPLHESAVYLLLESYRMQSSDSQEDHFFLELFDIETDSTANYEDTIQLFFQELITNHPSRPEPYILKAKFDREEMSDSSRIACLEFAAKLDSNHIEANYLLAQDYYDEFHRLMLENVPHEQARAVASKAYARIEKTYELDSANRVALKFPLIQLANYLGDTSKITHFKSEDSSDNLLVPIQFFSKLPEDWATNYTVGAFRASEIALMHVNGITHFLEYMSERSLLHTPDSVQVYRFIWHRSFHNKIIIRLEKSLDQVTIVWKETAYPYEPAGLVHTKSKELTTVEWDALTNKVEKAEFWNMKTLDDEFDGLDGASWILEGFDQGYHIVDRWSPKGTDFQACCMYLLSLTDLLTDELRVY